MKLAMERNIKYLVIDCTNKNGGTEPSIYLFNDNEEAVKQHNKHLANCIESELVKDEEGFEENHCFTLFESQDEDGDTIDNYGCHILKVKSGDTVVVVGDYSNEFIELDNVSAKEFLNEWDITSYDIHNVQGDEDAVVTSVSDLDIGTHYNIIEIK